MDDAQYARLFRALEQAYSIRQLDAYLRKSVHAISSATELVHDTPESVATPNIKFLRSSWRAGATPITERHSRSTSNGKCDAEKRKDDVIRHNMPEGVRMRHYDFDGGDLIGQRNELIMACVVEPTRGKGRGAYVDPIFELVRVGFGIARAITRLQARELKPAWEAPGGGAKQPQAHFGGQKIL